MVMENKEEPKKLDDLVEAIHCLYDALLCIHQELKDIKKSIREAADLY